MLSNYDEYPVHQSPRPFAHTPSTDFNWDEGYYFGVFNADEKVYMTSGMRINPNADMIGGYAIINIAGRQYSVRFSRFSRCWRRAMDTVIGHQPIPRVFKKATRSRKESYGEHSIKNRE